MNAILLRQAALNLIESEGLINVTRARLCELAGIPSGSFANVAGVGFTEFVERLMAEGHVGPLDSPAIRRAHPVLRRAQLIAAATRIAEDKGFMSVGRAEVAKRCGVSVALVAKYIACSTEDLSTEIMAHAVERGIAAVVAQGLAVRHPLATAAPEEIKAQAARHLTL